ncbi:hypothetical protein VMCG_01450 [Cytospora schulzeri]|uniref:Uncharacterized protein n=1 Tax=Cytospora schulzeri TaxID=448051 RepID=A0A423X556_9PEZI|nr:hypothetical protein VMCG_01450 [Valsa malicola]
MERPTSPSARFYASRGNSSTAHREMPPHAIPGHNLHPHYVPPFGHFQGFSAPSSSHENMSSQYATYSYQVPDDGWISPRMPIPNFSLFRGSPQPRVEELSDGPDDVPQPYRQSSQHRVSGVAATPGLHCGPARPCTRQMAGSPTQISPPPEYSSTPEHTPVPAFAETPLPAMLPACGAPTTTHPLNSPAAKPRNYHVPSEDEETSDVSTKGGSSKTAHSAAVASKPDKVISVLSDNDGNSTVYPNDSVSTPSCTTLPSLPGSDSLYSDVKRHLEEGVVEVHNVCLAVTQRYLEALRVNWELRHGRDVAVPLGGGPARRHRDRAGERGSPYPRAGGPWRHAVSEDGGGLEPTDSLLQNTSYICDLIWRRALRDRDDVLGAETGGCRDMGFLFECAETVVLYDAGEWEREPQRGFGRICQAGRDLCQELKDVKGVEVVNGIALRMI